MSYADNNALSASSVSISGSASVKFTAGSCIQLLQGFHAVAGGPNTFQAWVEAMPSAVSVSPASGTGLTQQFTWTASSPSGYGKLADVFLLFNSTSQSTQNACYLDYQVSSQTLAVINGTGNSQCSLSGGYSAVPAANQVAITATIAFQTGFQGAQNVYLRAVDQYGLDSEWQQMGTWTVPPPPQDFTLSTSPGTQTILANGQASYTISATPINGFSGTIALDAPALPPGAIAVFSPPSITANQTSRMTVSNASTAGNFYVTARGTSGSLSHSVSSVLNVQDFSLTATPSWQSVTVGGVATMTITAAGVNGFTGTLNLFSDSYPLGSSISCPSPHLSTGGSITCQLRLPANLGPGISEWGMGACYGSTGLCREVGVMLNVGAGPSFTLTASPVSQTVAPGGQAVYAINTAAVNGFSGTVYLNINNLPYGFSGAFDSASISVGQSTYLRVTVPAGASAGTYSIAVNGQSGSQTQQTTPTLTVASTGISVGVTPPSTTLTAGQAQQITANVTGSNNTAVTWSLSGPGTLTSTTVNTVQYNAPATISGNTTATITATSQADGRTTGTAQIALTVAPPPRFSVTAVVSPQGAGAVSVSPPPDADGLYRLGTVITVAAQPGPGYQFSDFAGGLSGTANPQTFEITWSTSVTANFTAFTGPTLGATGASSWLQANLSFMPFNYYDYNHVASTSGFSTSCPPSASVRSCFKSILTSLWTQGVSGIRVFVTFCDQTSTAFANCGAPYNQVSWDPTVEPGSTWIQNAATFFQDLRDAGIPNITITTGTSGPIFSLPANQTSSPSTPSGLTCADQGGNCCLDTQDTVYFDPSMPFGMSVSHDSNGNASYNPLGFRWPTGQNNGWNCAPINNQFFLGWTNLFNVTNALLSAVQGVNASRQPNQVVLNVYELEFMNQEIDMADFPVLLRYIVDNSMPQSAPPDSKVGYCNPNLQPPNSNGANVDVLCKLRQLMTSNGFDPGHVTWSAPWTDTLYTANDPATPDEQAVYNCFNNAYGDYARNIDLDEIWQALTGGNIGISSDSNVKYFLACGGTGAGMFPAPYYNSLPNLVDSHMYPTLDYPPDQIASQTSETQIQAVAQLDYSDLSSFLALAGLQSAQVVIGETFGGLAPDGTYGSGNCLNVPVNAAASNVSGFNQSALAKYSVVFRPWMEIEDPSGTCYPYGGGPGSSNNYQNVNYNGQGPYTPTNHQEE